MSSDLAIIPSSSVILGQSTEAASILQSIADKVNSYRPDISTTKGRKECASMAAQIASAKMDMVRLANGLMEADKARIAAVLSERKIIEEKMDALKQQVRAPLTEFEDREKARVAAHEELLSGIELLRAKVHEASSGDIEFALGQLAQVVGSNHDWQEFKVRAIDLIANVEADLRVALNNARAREHQAAELTRLQAIEAERAAQEAARIQAEREARIAKEAAEKAAIAEQQKAAAAALAAEQAARDAERAAQAKIEAAERAAEKAKRDAAVAAERAERERVAAVEAERARIAREAAEAQAAADRRAADLEHRKRINNELLADLKKLELAEAQAKALIKAVAKGEIRHLSIGY